MTDSQTRRDVEIIVTLCAVTVADTPRCNWPTLVAKIEEYVERLMAVPALRLAEKAEEKPEYRLAVIDPCDCPTRIIALEAR